MNYAISQYLKENLKNLDKLKKFFLRLFEINITDKISIF